MACYAIGTEVLDHTGKSVRVQDLQEGDLLMGSDGSARLISEIREVECELFKLSPTKGEPTVVGEDHTLYLTYSPRKGVGVVKSFVVAKWFDSDELRVRTKFFSFDNASKEIANTSAHAFLKDIVEDRTVHLEVTELTTLSKTMRGHLKLSRTGLAFSRQAPPPFNPYIVGYWLGDGSAAGTEITSQDATVLKYVAETIRDYNLMLVYKGQYSYNIRSIKPGTGSNALRNTLRTLNMLKNKHIPDIYKFGSRDTRLGLLAGLIDSDGHLIAGVCEIIQKSLRLASDITFVGRSLGFACYMKPCTKGCTYKGEYRSGTYYRIFISGHLNEVPVLCRRKQAAVRKQIKDVLVTGLTTSPMGVGKAVAISFLDATDHVLSDFTIHG